MQEPIDVRPPYLVNDDAVYISDDDVCVIKTEEWERRQIFRRSSAPFNGPGPIETVVISDDSESDNDDGGIRGKYILCALLRPVCHVSLMNQID